MEVQWKCNKSSANEVHALEHSEKLIFAMEICAVWYSNGTGPALNETLYTLGDLCYRYSIERNLNIQCDTDQIIFAKSWLLNKH